MSSRSAMFAAAVLLVVSSPVVAQTASRSGGGTASGARRGHALDGTLTLAGAFDAEPFANVTLATPGGVPEPALYSRAIGRLAYRFDSRRVSVVASARSGLDHYPSLGNLMAPTHDASGRMAAVLGRRTTVSVGHGIGYAPFYTLRRGGFDSIDETGFAVASGDRALGRAHTWRQDTAVDLTHRLGRRTTVTALYGRSSFASKAFESVEQRAGGRLTHAISRGLRLRAGYVDRRVTGAQPDATVREIDAGVDFGRALSLTRQTTVSFGTGSALLGDQSGLRFHLLGHVDLAHQFGRTWNAAARYERGVDFVEAVGRAMVANSAGLSLTGQLTRRVGVSAHATSVRAAAAPSAAAVSSHGASAAMRVALSRRVSAFAEYSVYRYDLGGAPLLLDVAPAGRRHGARVGLSWRIPLVGGSR